MKEWPETIARARVGSNLMEDARRNYSTWLWRSDIEDNKNFGSSKRTRTWPSRVANLIGKSKVVERIVIEKLTIPSLSTMVRWVIMWFYHVRLTSMWCKGRVWWTATVHSGHFNILPLAQSLHLIIPSPCWQVEHLVWPKKSPSLSCRSTSSRKVLRNSSHSFSRCFG